MFPVTPLGAAPDSRLSINTYSILLLFFDAHAEHTLTVKSVMHYFVIANFECFLSTS